MCRQIRYFLYSKKHNINHECKTRFSKPPGKSHYSSDIAPKWAKRLEEEKKLPFPLSIRWFKWYFELDIPSRCIVGEANGSSSMVQKRV